MRLEPDVVGIRPKDCCSFGNRMASDGNAVSKNSVFSSYLTIGCPSATDYDGAADEGSKAPTQSLELQ